MNTINTKIDKQYELYINDTNTILIFNQLSFNKCSSLLTFLCYS